MMKKKFSISLFSGFGSVDAEQFVIRGVSVATAGYVRGYDVWLDAQSLETIRLCAERKRRGVRVRFGHEDHASGAASVVGVMKDFVIEENKLRADLYLLSSHPSTPVVLELATRFPDAVGCSIMFRGHIETGSDGLNYVRCDDLIAVDIVAVPAANPDGMFSDAENNTEEKMENQPTTQSVQLSEQAAPNEPTAPNSQPSPTKASENTSAVEKSQPEVTCANAVALSAPTELEQIKAQLQELKQSIQPSDVIAKAVIEQLAALGVPLKRYDTMADKPADLVTAYSELSKLSGAERARYYDAVVRPLLFGKQ